VLSGTAFAAATFVAGDASAQEASAQDIAQARQLGQQAQAAYDAGNFAESEKLWLAASRLYSQAPTLSLGLARAQTKLGHVVGAQEAYNKIIREWSNVASPSPAFKDALEAAKAEVGAVSARIAHVVLTVEGPANPQVTIDGQPVPAAALGLKRPVDGGQHVVKASAEGYKPGETTFSVAEGKDAEAKIVLEKLPDAVVAGPVGPQTGPTTGPGADTGAKSGSPNKTLALVAFGVGGVGLVAGAITGVIAMGKHSDLESACKEGTCPGNQQDAVDSYQTMGLLSTIGFIVAGVGGATGALLWFTAPKETASAGGSRYATVPASPASQGRAADRPASQGRAADRPASAGEPRTGFSVTPYFGGTAAGFTGRF